MDQVRQQVTINYKLNTGQSVSLSYVSVLQSVSLSYVSVLHPEFGVVFGVKEACVTSSTLLVNTVIFLAVLPLCQIS